MRGVQTFGLVLLAALLPWVALAHPHVWATTTITMLTDKGMLTGMHVQWVFDELYSASFVPDADRNGNGKLDDAEALAMARTVFVDGAEGLKPFMLMAVNGVRLPVAFANPRIRMADDDELHYQFDVMLAKPVPLQGNLKIATYDPEFYIDFEQEPALKAVPSACKAVLREDAQIRIYNNLVSPQVYHVACTGAA